MMRIRSALSIFLVALAVINLVGCQGYMPAQNQPQSLSSGSPLLPPGVTKNASIPDSVDRGLLSMAEQSGTPESQEADFMGIVNELEKIGKLDRVSKRQLMVEYQNAKPENRPLIVKHYQSILAIRQQQMARDSQVPVDDPFAPPKSTSAELVQVSHETSKKETVPAAPIVNPSNVVNRPEPEASTVVISDEVLSQQEPAEEVVVESVRRLPKSNISSRHRVTAEAPSGQAAIQQASYEAALESPPKTWQEHLQAAIVELDAVVSKSPSSTDEVHDHMRLRMLKMLAGEEEGSLSSIPSASSLQQDYWAKQMFAVSTFLDNRSQPDDKRRAAGSLVQLDQARAKLSEMATLQISNLSFVESVDGFGVYQLRENEKFSPGDQVTLYAEVDNFRSDSTKEGYRTVLGTSYEVVDDRGQRVDSAQFPDVVDLCRNRRHDFHMQYGVALPTRIYAGEYQLKITVTDQLSHKISQTSVPFTIVE